jgi:hypothetical protein
MGTRRNVSESLVTAMVLDKFYQKPQVMTGEAIAGSELAAMLKEQGKDAAPFLNRVRRDVPHATSCR